MLKKNLLLSIILLFNLLKPNFSFCQSTNWLYLSFKHDLQTPVEKLIVNFLSSSAFGKNDELNYDKDLKSQTFKFGDFELNEVSFLHKGFDIYNYATEKKEHVSYILKSDKLVGRIDNLSFLNYDLFYDGLCTFYGRPTKKVKTIKINETELDVYSIKDIYVVFKYNSYIIPQEKYTAYNYIRFNNNVQIFCFKSLNDCVSYFVENFKNERKKEKEKLESMAFDRFLERRLNYPVDYEDYFPDDTSRINNILIDSTLIFAKKNVLNSSFSIEFFIEPNRNYTTTSLYQGYAKTFFKSFLSTIDFKPIIKEQYPNYPLLIKHHFKTNVNLVTKVIKIKIDKNNFVKSKENLTDIDKKNILELKLNKGSHYINLHIATIRSKKSIYFSKYVSNFF